MISAAVRKLGAALLKTAGTKPITPEAQPGIEITPVLEPRWKALPGQVIELGATGFQIKLDTSPTGPLYQLSAPEGWCLLGSSDLPTLKLVGERFARERDEFVFTAPAP